jgi:hypothetical protein
VNIRTAAAVGRMKASGAVARKTAFVAVDRKTAFVAVDRKMALVAVDRKESKQTVRSPAAPFLSSDSAAASLAAARPGSSGSGCLHR